MALRSCGRLFQLSGATQCTGVGTRKFAGAVEWWVGEAVASTRLRLLTGDWDLGADSSALVVSSTWVAHLCHINCRVNRAKV